MLFCLATFNKNDSVIADISPCPLKKSRTLQCFILNGVIFLGRWSFSACDVHRFMPSGFVKGNHGKRCTSNISIIFPTSGMKALFFLKLSFSIFLMPSFSFLDGTSLEKRWLFRTNKMFPSSRLTIAVSCFSTLQWSRCRT